MCLILHKPQNAKLDWELLHSASQYNPHGYGVMALTGQHKIRVVRGLDQDFEQLRSTCTHFSKHECVIHLRLRTRGHINQSNTHPFKLSDSVYMAHNGTLDIGCRIPGRSDSWHMANDILAPALQRAPSLLHNGGFQRYLSETIGAHNRMVFMDAQSQKTVIVNQALGVEYRGVWLSNTKWFDAARFGLAMPDAPGNDAVNRQRAKLRLSGERFGRHLKSYHADGRSYPTCRTEFTNG